MGVGPPHMLTKQPTASEPNTWPRRDRTIPTANKARARAMRVEPTQAERKLWWHLRYRLHSRKSFSAPSPTRPLHRRFRLPSASSRIEIDGGRHAERTAPDEQRTQFLESEGYRVLRFWNIDVLKNIDGVLEVIHNEIAALSAGGPTPTPTPPHKGEG